MNKTWIFVLLLLLLLLLVAVTTNLLIKVPLLCRWCLVAAAHRWGCCSVASAHGRWWRTSQGAAHRWGRPSNVAARGWCRHSMAAGRARPWHRSMEDDDGHSMMASAQRGWQRSTAADQWGWKRMMTLGDDTSPVSGGASRPLTPGTSCWFARGVMF
jgi:hypothetical protein